MRKGLLCMRSISVKLNNIKLAYWNNVVINDLSYEFNGPGLYIIKGKNGCGKSTLFKALLNLKKLDGGSIESTSKIKGIIEEPSGYFDLSSDKQLEYLTGHKTTDLYDLINKFEMNEHLKKSFNSLSLGMKEKLSLLYLLNKDDDVLLLDEPTVAIDYQGVETLIKIINELMINKLILIATHDYYFINKVRPDHILQFDNGMLVEDFTNDKVSVNVKARRDLVDYFVSNKLEYEKLNDSYNVYLTDSELNDLFSSRKDLEILDISFKL